MVALDSNRQISHYQKVQKKREVHFPAVSKRLGLLIMCLDIIFQSSQEIKRSALFMKIMSKEEQNEILMSNYATK